MPELSLTPAALAGLFEPVAGADRLGLAVSGGPDSLALLVAAARWAAAPGRPALFVYTLDHGLRPEAAGEAAMVADAAARFGLACRVLAWTGPKPESGVQAAARAARYRLIGEAMRADGASLLLTAHHAEDQAETVLMRLAHGSGLSGLKGMTRFAEVEGVTLFRPFLSTPGAALRALLADTGLTPARDPSNTDPAYERVRWRALLPQLAAAGLDATTLADFARRMGEADAVLAELTERALLSHAACDDLGALSFPLAAFQALPPAIAARVLARLLVLAGGAMRPHALGAVEALRDDLLRPGFAGAALSLCLVRLRAGTLHVLREPGRHPPAAQRLEPGADLVWDGRFALHNGRDDALTVAMATDWTRAQAEAFIQAPVAAPSEAFRAAPVIRDGHGTVLSLGGRSRHDGLRVVPLARASVTKV